MDARQDRAILARRRAADKQGDAHEDDESAVEAAAAATMTCSHLDAHDHQSASRRHSKSRAAAATDFVDALTADVAKIDALVSGSQTVCSDR